MAARENRSRLKILPNVAFAALSLLFLWRIAVVLGPDSDYTLFTSDSVFPILMSNQDRSITLFDYYSYNRDRWGSFPFLLARFVHQLTGYYWSPESMHLYRTIWLVAGLLVMTSLATRARLLLLVSALIAICLPSITRINMFDLSELYQWQIPGLFLSWYSIRQLFAAKLENSTTSPTIEKRGLWCFVLFSVSFLTVWISVASGPLLCFLLLLEGSWAVLKADRKNNSTWRRGRYLVPLLVLVIGILSEKVLRTYYHSYCLKHYGSENRTPMAVDFGHLGQNLAAQVHVYSSFSRRPLIVLSSILLVVVAVVLVYFCWRMRLATPREIVARSIDELWIFVFGITGMGVINFVMAVSIEHVRLNFFANRYLTLTFVFVVISNLLTLFLIFRRLFQRAHLDKYYASSFTLALALFLLVRFPTQSASRYYQIVNDTAVALAEKAPDAALMGRYWATYIFVALQGPKAMLAVPEEGEDVRMPWTLAMLPDAKEVVLEYRHSSLATSGVAPVTINQYGNTFRLVDPNFYTNENFSFALYVKELKNTQDLRQ